MKKFIAIVLLSFVAFACSKGKKEVMIVQGEVKNLKKGTLFLQKTKDTLFISVDSITIDGDGKFSLSDKIESPEMYYLTLDHSTDKMVPFFGEAGTITINTNLDRFGFGAKITGLGNQQLLDEYQEMKSKFTDKHLNLVKDGFEAKKEGDSMRADSIEKAMLNLLKSRYRYTANFAITHPDNEVSPYLALSEMYDANKTWLDSIYNSLTPKVKKSKYGLELEKYLSQIQ